MVKEITYKGKKIFICEACGFGYAEKDIAKRCEKHCTTQHSCSLEITKQAVKTK